MDVHPTGCYLISGGEDSKIKIWDVRKGLLSYTLYSHTEGVNCVKYNQAGDFFASGANQHILIW